MKILSFVGRTWMIATGLLAVVGCASTEENPYARKLPASYLHQMEQANRYKVESALTVDAPIPQSESFQLEIPVVFFKDVLPSRLHHKGIGIINDTDQFTQMWNLYSRDNTALMPSIDFKTKALLFIYDATYYNRVAIAHMSIDQGVANPQVWHTNTTLPLQEKAYVAFLQIPRNLPNRPGVTAIYANGEVISVPKAP